eukprot:351484-Pelagomonas_calceolata.AAC.1
MMTGALITMSLVLALVGLTIPRHGNRFMLPLVNSVDEVLLTQIAMSLVLALVGLRIPRHGN